MFAKNLEIVSNVISFAARISFIINVGYIIVSSHHDSHSFTVSGTQSVDSITDTFSAPKIEL